MVYDILHTELQGAREGDVSLMGHIHSLTDYSKCNNIMQADHRQVSIRLPDNWQIQSERKDKQNEIKVASYSKITQLNKKQIACT